MKKNITIATALLKTYHAAKSEWSNIYLHGTPAQKAAATRKMNKARDAHDSYMECGKFCNPR